MERRAGGSRLGVGMLLGAGIALGAFYLGHHMGSGARDLGDGTMASRAPSGSQAEVRPDGAAREGDAAQPLPEATPAKGRALEAVGTYVARGMFYPPTSTMPGGGSVEYPVLEQITALTLRADGTAEFRRFAATLGSSSEAIGASRGSETLLTGIWTHAPGGTCHLVFKSQLSPGFRGAAPYPKGPILIKPLRVERGPGKELVLKNLIDARAWIDNDGEIVRLSWGDASSRDGASKDHAIPLRRFGGDLPPRPEVE